MLKHTLKVICAFLIRFIFSLSLALLLSLSLSLCVCVCVLQNSLCGIELPGAQTVHVFLEF
jgi:hypothetical protein